MRTFSLLAISALSLACNTTPASQESKTQESKSQESKSQETKTDTGAQPAAPAADAELTLVTDTSQVCMVNNQYMGRPQIPVEVEGKTYFGCCEMCKKRLAENPDARAANDPVSGKPVDKATAVIARRANGEVLYFESAETFARYRTL
jgi:YHS domain-containing protein